MAMLAERAWGIGRQVRGRDSSGKPNDWRALCERRQPIGQFVHVGGFVVRVVAGVRPCDIAPSPAVGWLGANGWKQGRSRMGL